MHNIKNVLLVVMSDIFLVLRRLLGCKVTFDLISIISPCSSIKTKNKGTVCIGRKTCTRANTELSANSGSLVLGDNCFVNRNCMIVAHESIVIGEGTTIGPGTYIYDHDHDGSDDYVSENITIGTNVWIGANCVILKGVSIGDNVVIGAGSIVTKSIPENALMYQERKDVVVFQENIK